MPSCSKNAIVSRTENPRRTRRTTDRGPPQKSVSSTVTLVTLQREPPLTRIFAPGLFAPSSSSTDWFGVRRRVKIAVARPAAPAPTTMTLLRELTGGGDSLEVGDEALEHRFDRFVLGRLRGFG